MTGAATPIMKPTATMYVDLAFLLGMVQEWHAEAKATGQETGFRIDISRIAQIVRRRYEVPLVEIYDAAPADGRRAVNWKLHHFLQRNPRFKMHVRRSQEPPGYEQKEVDVQIACDMLRDAHARVAAHMVLVTGDHDFVPAIEAVRQLGVQVVLASFFRNRAQRALRQAVNSVIDLDDEPIVSMQWSARGVPSP